MYYFISYTLFYVLNTPFRCKTTSFAQFAIVANDGLFWLSIVTSREREALALWRNLRRLFLHAQSGAKAIFTSE